MQGFAGDSVGGVTQAANTIIQFLIPPSGPAPTGTVNAGFEKVVAPARGITRPTKIQYANLQTLQTVKFMRHIGTTNLAAAAAGGQKVLNMTADPGLAAGNNLAANDFIALRESDGVTRLYKIGNLASPSQMNTTANLTVGALAGASVWDFGAAGDTDPVTGNAHSGPLQAVNTTTASQDDFTGIFPSHVKDAPILVNSDNAGPGAGTIAFLSWLYTTN
jgi:hypothetical protein